MGGDVSGDSTSIVGMPYPSTTLDRSLLVEVDLEHSDLLLHRTVLFPAATMKGEFLWPCDINFPKDMHPKTFLQKRAGSWKRSGKR